MRNEVAVLKFNTSTNCFITLPLSWSRLLRNEMSNHASDHSKSVVIELQSEHTSVLTSWSGEMTSAFEASYPVVEMNSVFAAENNLTNNQLVIVSQVKNLLPCSSISLEPIAMNDWNRLEMNATLVEKTLLKQLRVVYMKEVIPIWIQSFHTYLLVHITSLYPTSKCLLQANTEVILTTRTTHKDVVDDEELVELSRFEKLNNFYSENINSSQLLHTIQVEFPLTSISNEASEDICFINNSIIDHSFHIKLLCLDDIIANFFVTCQTLPLSCSHSHDNGHIDTTKAVIMKHPSTIYISLFAVQSIMLENCSSAACPASFIAVISKLWSAMDSLDGKNNSVKETNAMGPNDIKAVVQVVVINDKQNIQLHSDDMSILIPSPSHILMDHVLMPKLLMEQMHVFDCDYLLIEQISAATVIPESLWIEMLFQPECLSLDNLMNAVKSWFSINSSFGMPLVVFDGMIINCHIENDVMRPFRIKFNSKDKQTTSDVPSHAVITTDNLRSISIIMDNYHSPLEIGSSVQKMPYSIFSKADLKSRDFHHTAMIPDHLNQCIFSYMDRCIYHQAFNTAFYADKSDINFSAILLSGTHGTGKTTLVRTLFKDLTLNLNTACLFFVECKALQGKKIGTIHNTLNTIFKKATIMQPSVIYLDDLDYIAGFLPSGDEVTTETMHIEKVAEVIKDLMELTSKAGSEVALIIGCQSKNALCSSLLTAKGRYVTTRVIELNCPNQEQRCYSLSDALAARKVPEDTIRILPLPSVAQKMNGFVHKDIESVADRALCSYLTKYEESCDGIVNIFLVIELFNR